MSERVYSAEEVIRIIESATAAGMRTIDIAGFKGAWDIGTNQKLREGKADPKGISPEDRLAELGRYVCPMKKYRGLMLSEIPKGDLKTYLDWFEEMGELKETAAEFVARAREYLMLLESLRN